MAEKYNLIQSIKTAVSRVVVGRERTIDLMTAAFLLRSTVPFNGLFFNRNSNCVGDYE